MGSTRSVAVWDSRSIHRECLRTFSLPSVLVMTIGTVGRFLKVPAMGRWRSDFKADPLDLLSDHARGVDHSPRPAAIQHHLRASCGGGSSNWPLLPVLLNDHAKITWQNARSDPSSDSERYNAKSILRKS